ncbi:MAG: SIMPL domain-containing protein [Rhizobiales bacterium]|nr:SIMPL domain-containing protein [Hyphomicrobiales bacterium]
MNAMNKVLIGIFLAGVSLSSSQSHAGQLPQPSDVAKIAQTMKLHPLRTRGQALVTIRADKMSVNLSMSAVADTMDGIINSLKQRRDEMFGKVGSGALNVIGTEISSLRINKQGGNTPSYRGEVQMTVEFTGFEDPLDAVAELADEKVTRVGSLRYGFSKELLEEQDLCEVALTDARKRAVKQAEAAGFKLGRLIQHQCNDGHIRHRGYSSKATMQVNVSVSATFEREK